VGRSGDLCGIKNPSEHFSVNADWPCVCVPVSVVVGPMSRGYVSMCIDSCGLIALIPLTIR
jgi:hypothetical protein